MLLCYSRRGERAENAGMSVRQLMMAFVANLKNNSEICLALTEKQEKKKLDQCSTVALQTIIRGEKQNTNY
jgi:hypothetical protein